MIRLADGWEKCETGEATHGYLPNGEIFTIINNDHIFYANGTLVNKDHFDAFGITPVRKVEVKLIEFRVRGILDAGHSYGTQLIVGESVITTIPEDWSGKTFREVIV